MTARLVVDGSSKVFAGGRGVLRADATFNFGEITAIVGPSGCGKTTLLRLIAGLLRPDKGRIEWEGVPVQPAKIALMFQEPRLFPHLSVEANIALPFTLASRRLLRLWTGKVAPSDYPRVAELADMLSISHLLGRRVSDLSGGEAQRVALARALATDADVFLLDEPLASIDEEQRQEFADLLNHLLRRQRQRQALSIYVSHDLVEAGLLADKVVVMVEGATVQSGSPEQVFERPVDVRTAKFLAGGEYAELPGRVVEDGDGIFLHVADAPGCRLSIDPSNPRARIGRKCTAIIRGGRLDGSGDPLGALLSLRSLGTRHYATIGLAGRQVTLPILGDHGSQIGDLVSVRNQDWLIYDG